MSGSLRYPYPDRLFSSQIYPALLPTEPPEGSPTAPSETASPGICSGHPHVLHVPRSVPAPRPSSDAVDSHQALCWMSPALVQHPPGPGGQARSWGDVRMHPEPCPWPTDRPAHSATAGEGALGVHPTLRPTASSVSAVRGVQSSQSPTLETRTCGHGRLGQLKKAELPTH